MRPIPLAVLEGEPLAVLDPTIIESVGPFNQDARSPPICGRSKETELTAEKTLTKH